MARKKRSMQEHKQTFGLIVQLYPNKEQETLLIKSCGKKHARENAAMNIKQEGLRKLRA